MIRSRPCLLLACLPLLLPAAWAQGAGGDEDPFARLYGDQGDLGEETLPEEPVARAGVLVRRGRHDEARDLLAAALAESPEDTAARATLARLELKTGQLEAADAEADRLLELDPTLAVGHLLRGQVRELRGQLTEAEDAYRTARALSRKEGGPVQLESLVRLGELLAPTDKHDEAGRLLEEVLERYQRRQELSAEEFVWTARACRGLDVFPAIERQYARRMVEYSRRMLDQALLADPRCAEACYEAGVLALLKYDVPSARRSLERACRLDPNLPDARVSLAEATLQAFYAGQGRFDEASQQLQAALAIDPDHAGAHALLAAMAVTDGHLGEAAERLDTALRARPADVSLQAVRAAIHLLRGEAERFQALEQGVLATRPRCAAFYQQAAELVSLKFRYAEARDLARKALTVDPDFHPALAVLGVNLTRTGDEAEGQKALRQAFERDPYNIYTFNQLELFDRLEKNYVTVETDHFTLRLHKDEAPSTGYVTALLDEARQRLGEKYGAFPDKVLVELFPDHNDFSARSVGLPGIPALGVCFGNVVTVLSANEKKAVGAHSWGRTLWHELTHVATLTRTHNRIPRWFTEGLSVYEESRGRPSWQREYDAEIMTLMARELLLPIADLDAGFTKPRYANQVIMAYYQGGMTCEFVALRWGFPAILRLLDAFAEGLDTAAAVRRELGLEPTEFDVLFRAFLERRYARYALASPPSLEERDALLRAVSARPLDVAARGALARAYALHGLAADAEQHAGIVLKQVPGLVESWGVTGGIEALRGGPAGATLAAARGVSLRAGLADAHLALGLVHAQRGHAGRSLRHLRQALQLGTRDAVRAHQVRGSILRAQGHLPEAIASFLAAARLSPPSADLHRLLRACYVAVRDEARAMAELKRVCQLDSEDMQSRLEYANWARQRQAWSEVVDVLDDASMIDPFNPEAHLLLGDGLRRSAGGVSASALERAAGEYRAALALNVKYRAGALIGLAWCLHRLGQDDEARARLAEGVRDDPDNAEGKELRERLGPLPEPAPEAPPAAPEPELPEGPAPR